MAADGGDPFLPAALQLDDERRALQVEAVLRGLAPGGAVLRRVGDVFRAEMERGLRGEPSSLQMENTYVPELPDGTEEGVFVALDLGGTNFRVLLLELRAGSERRQRVRQYHVSDELRLGAGERLFEFLADCVLEFLRAEGMERDDFSLGFTFSFPMRQHSISSGTLITWTKSFKCSGMEGVDVAALLQSCLRRRGLRGRVAALLNDTTGTLVAGAHSHRDVAIGVILGTGSNGCYMERADRVRHWEAAHERVHDVCVDVEWGAFGDNGRLDFLRTEIDDEVDAGSLLVKSFTFEKYIGGKYLGELLAAALRALHRAALFPVSPPPGRLLAAHLSLFEEEAAAGRTERTLAALSGSEPGAALSPDDARVAQYAARLLAARAAQLVSVCVAALVQRVDRDHVAVAVDGSVFRRHPAVRRLMERYIALLAPARRFTLLEAEDGSGKGSALTAAVAARLAAQL